MQEGLSPAASSQEWIARQGRLQSAAAARAVATANLLEKKLKGLQASLLTEQSSLIKKYPDAIPDAKQTEEALEALTQFSNLNTGGGSSSPDSLSGPLLQKICDKLEGLEEATKEAHAARTLQNEALQGVMHLPDSMSHQLEEKLSLVTDPLGNIESRMNSINSHQSSSSGAIQEVNASLQRVSDQISTFEASVKNDAADMSKGRAVSQEVLAQLKTEVAELNASVSQLTASASKMRLEKESQEPKVSS